MNTKTLTNFVYIFQKREFIYKIYEEIYKTHLTTNINRIDNFEHDFSPKIINKIHEFLKHFEKTLIKFKNLLLHNRIFINHTIKINRISKKRTLSYNFTDPNLRTAKINYDVQVTTPYYSYNNFDFIIPIRTHNNTYDRFYIHQTKI